MKVHRGGCGVPATVDDSNVITPGAAAALTATLGGPAAVATMALGSPLGCPLNNTASAVTPRLVATGSRLICVLALVEQRTPSCCSHMRGSSK